MSATLAARGLVVRYAGAPGQTTPALGPLTFELAPGTFSALVGPSGSGKSTLVRVLAGLVHPSQGQACVDGHAVRGPQRRIGLMQQEPTLLPWRTVADNVTLPLALAGVAPAERQATAARLLPALGLDGFGAALPGELSGGMAQRVALGRVLAAKPDVLLLDEPFGALDALTREGLRADLLRLWHNEGLTVLMVTHDIQEAVQMADRVLVLSQRPGRVVADVAVTLPRPRAPEHVYDSAFGAVVGQVRAALGL